MFTSLLQVPPTSSWILGYLVIKTKLVTLEFQEYRELTQEPYSQETRFLHIPLAFLCKVSFLKRQCFFPFKNVPLPRKVAFLLTRPPATLILSVKSIVSHD